ncbi:MAG: class I SAM-dependent methyltransferase [Proteobacteria bacterium]|nr:class I SAM-dependent methyltransferase [Pseudomonadota bacterium]
MVGSKTITHITIEKKVFSFRQFHSPVKPYVNLTDAQRKLAKEFNQEAEDGRIEFESVPCLCGSTTFDLIASVDKFSMLQQTVLCIKCGLIQSNPRMTQKEYANFYSSDLYRKCYESEAYLHMYESKYIEETGQHIFDEISKIKAIDSDCSVLEIGAGGGWNLLPFIKRGAHVLGIDYSPSLVSLGMEHGINMAEGNVSAIEGTYDIIIINHVLEHLMNPVNSLKGIYKNLKRDGLIYIAVPNILNFNMGQLQNAHTYYFVPRSFLHYCALSGLRSIIHGPAEVIHMFGIFKYNDSDVTDVDLGNNYKETYSHLRKTRFEQYAKILLSNFHLKRMARTIYHNVFRRA